jgi:tRNA(Ile)-lysidine synthase
MLHLFSQIREEYKLKLFCAHFNHCLRQEADEEEEFVKNLCKGLDIKFVSAKKDVNKFLEGDSLEQTARNLRFDFFLKCARELKTKKIALAHHKDDVVETIIMRIIRGTALKGLRGILPKSKFKGIFFVRPLIEMGKTEILDWLNTHRITYKIDKTNFEDKFFRNKIRLRLMPLLQEFNPNIVNTLFNLAKTTSLDYEFIYTSAKEKFNCLKKQKGKSYIKLDLVEIRKFDIAMIFNILILAIEELKGNTRKLELRHLEEVLDLIYRRPLLSIVDLPDLEVKKEDNWLIIKSLLF